MYVGPPYCRAEMYARRVACYPLSHGEYADGTDRQTDRQTPDRCITLFAIVAASVRICETLCILKM